MAAAVVTSCVPGRAAAATIPHVLRFATAEEVATLNPIINTQTVVGYLDQMTAAFCFRVDKAGALVPELVTTVPTQRNGGISRDGKTIVLHFRRGVRWSDGVPFDADDFAFTVRTIDDPKVIVPNRNGFDRIATVGEPDRYTAIVRLRTPYGAIVPTLFANANANAILPRHAFPKGTDVNTAAFNALPIGIGPFRYRAWRRGEAIELERNPYYWRGRAKLDRVEMKLIPDRNTILLGLRSGDLDLWYPFGGAFYARVAAMPNARVLRRPSYGLNFLALNCSRAVFAQPAVRAALRYAIDRRYMRDTVGHGVGLLQDVVVPRADPATPDLGFTERNVAKANALLDAAGWTRGPDGVRSRKGVRLSIDLASSVGTPDVDTSIEIVRANLRDVGAELDVRRYQASLLFAPYDQGGIMMNGRFDLMFLGFTYGVPSDVSNVLACDQVPPAGRNGWRYCNPKFDAVARAYDAAYDPAERARLLRRALAIVNADVPIIVTTGREDLFGLSRAVTGFDPAAAAPFGDMLGVDVR